MEDIQCQCHVCYGKSWWRERRAPMRGGAGLRAATTCRDEEVLHLSVRAGCITLIPSPCFLLMPIVCLTHVSSVPCHLSSRVRVMNHLHLGHFWNRGHKKRREPIAVAPSQMGTKPCCSGFTRQTDITVARDVPPSWAGVDVPVSKDTAYQACLKKELKKVMARAHSQL